jgi:hypothetical protein
MRMRLRMLDGPGGGDRFLSAAAAAAARDRDVRPYVGRKMDYAM